MRVTVNRDRAGAREMTARQAERARTRGPTLITSEGRHLDGFNAIGRHLENNPDITHQPPDWRVILPSGRAVRFDSLTIRDMGEMAAVGWIPDGLGPTGTQVGHRCNGCGGYLHDIGHHEVMCPRCDVSP